MTFGLGALPDAYDHRDKPVGALLSGTGSIPSSLTHEAAALDVLSQKSVGACTGFAICKMAKTWAGIRGIPCDEFAPLVPYWLGRWLGRDGNGPIHDTGAYPRDVSIAMQRYGFVTEDAWPFDVSKVNDSIPLDVLSDACSHAIDSFYRVTSFDGQRSQDLRQALAEGHPATITLDVDQAFMDHGDASVIGLMTGPSNGLHRLCVVGYRPGAFRIINSWGTGWGDNGLCWVSDDRIESDGTRDIECATLISL